MDHILHPVVPCLIVLLRKFAVFAYKVINRFVFAITYTFNSVAYDRFWN